MVKEPHAVGRRNARSFTINQTPPSQMNRGPRAPIRGQWLWPELTFRAFARLGEAVRPVR